MKSHHQDAGPVAERQMQEAAGRLAFDHPPPKRNRLFPKSLDSAALLSWRVSNAPPASLPRRLTMSFDDRLSSGRCVRPAECHATDARRSRALVENIEHRTEPRQAPAELPRQSATRRGKRRNQRGRNKQPGNSATDSLESARNPCLPAQRPLDCLVLTWRGWPTARPHPPDRRWRPCDTSFPHW
jgi:hypothetical protein